MILTKHHLPFSTLIFRSKQWTLNPFHILSSIQTQLIKDSKPLYNRKNNYILPQYQILHWQKADTKFMFSIQWLNNINLITSSRKPILVFHHFAQWIISHHQNSIFFPQIKKLKKQNFIVSLNFCSWTNQRQRGNNECNQSKPLKIIE